MHSAVPGRSEAERSRHAVQFVMYGANSRWLVHRFRDSCGQVLFPKKQRQEKSSKQVLSHEKKI